MILFQSMSVQNIMPDLRSFTLINGRSYKNSDYYCILVLYSVVPGCFSSLNQRIFHELLSQRHIYTLVVTLDTQSKIKEYILAQDKRSKLL